MLPNNTSPSKLHSENKNCESYVTHDDKEYLVLMVAEKPSIAKAIAEALAGKEGFTYRKGICKYCSIYEFKGTMFGKKAMFKVTSVIGHIFTSDFPP